MVVYIRIQTKIRLQSQQSTAGLLLKDSFSLGQRSQIGAIGDVDTVRQRGHDYGLFHLYISAFEFTTRVLNPPPTTLIRKYL